MRPFMLQLIYASTQMCLMCAALHAGGEMAFAEQSARSGQELTNVTVMVVTEDGSQVVRDASVTVKKAGKLVVRQRPSNRGVTELRLTPGTYEVTAELTNFYPSRRMVTVSDRQAWVVLPLLVYLPEYPERRKTLELTGDIQPAFHVNEIAWAKVVALYSDAVVEVPIRSGQFKATVSPGEYLVMVFRGAVICSTQKVNVEFRDEVVYFRRGPGGECGVVQR